MTDATIPGPPLDPDNPPPPPPKRTPNAQTQEGQCADESEESAGPAEESSPE